MRTSTILLSLVAAGTGAVLTSCVDPYYGGSTTATVTTTHRPGYVVQTLPSGYRTEVIGGTNYYYHDNVYYRPQGRSYVVVDSPRHSGGGRDRDWDGNRGRDRDRDWDRDRGDHRGHDHGSREVTVIRELPRGYKVVTRNGQRYYHSGDVYYQSRANGYVVVQNPF